MLLTHSNFLMMYVVGSTLIEMEQYTILNSKEIRAIVNLLKEDYGIKDFKFDCGILKSTKNKLYLISMDLSKADLRNLRINSIGMYFAEYRDGFIRLSIEGSQIIGKLATKNVAELNEEELNDWVVRNNIVYGEAELDGFVIIKHKGDFFGCGRYKEGIISNYISKDRRIKALTISADTE